LSWKNRLPGNQAPFTGMISVIMSGQMRFPIWCPMRRKTASNFRTGDAALDLKTKLKNLEGQPRSDFPGKMDVHPSQATAREFFAGNNPAF
jgi:hypothetical protein